MHLATIITLFFLVSQIMVCFFFSPERAGFWLEQSYNSIILFSYAF